MPAIDRYNGVAFRVVRKFLNQEKSASLDIFILSAQFGLISSHELIPNYDRKAYPANGGGGGDKSKKDSDNISVPIKKLVR